ncbi:PREDICTED: chymotrypsin-2-like [Ceratosolen solmsi marchali]|uniref:Chymotrypsin-2-like n=1 Tax=Ceratosolen solmsi marchali TaxID=326594 RepID=A0AAJ6YUL4_9HYME|nr:PREDICTED: chymotrypsin-2-like [Ceratosolen solmsi marchali]
MNLINLIYFSLTFIIGISAKHVKIVGGYKVDIVDFPYAVSLRYFKQNQHFCGGSIISEWHILTAAHCLYKKEHRYHNMKIYTGSVSTMRANGTNFDIGNVFIHPQYRLVQSEHIIEHHDIAIIVTTAMIHFNEFQQKIKLPSTPVIADKVGILVGWGATNFNSTQAANELQFLEMAIFDNMFCAKFLFFTLQDEQFCAFHNENAGAYVGDSGTPLTINDEVVGIVSFSCGCNEAYPDIYTKIYSYLDFINDIIMKK